MKHSRMYDVIKRYFDRGNYDADDVRKFVKAGKITPEEFKEITGEDYE